MALNHEGSGERRVHDKNNFRGISELSPVLQERIINYRTQLESRSLSDTDFINEPPILGDNREASLYLSGVNFSVPSYRDKGNPVAAYYFLSSLLREVSTIGNIEFSPDYLRFIGEWIGAASQSADFLSVQKKVVYIEALISHHTNIVTSGKDVFSDDVEVSDELIFVYRDKLLNIIVNLAFFYSHIGEYTELSRLTKLGGRIATLFCSAQMKFDIIVLELGTLLTQGESASNKLDSLLAEAYQGILILEKTYSEKPEYAIYNERNKSQIAVLELFLRMRRANLGDIAEIADIFRKRDELFTNTSIDDSKRQRLIHIEIFLYIAFKEFQKNTESIVTLIKGADQNFEYVKDRCSSIDTDGFNLKEYLEKPNARLFLGPFIELFKYNVRELYNQKHPGRIQQNQAMVLMIEIYRIAVGVGDKSENRAIFKKLSFFPSFIKNAKLLLLSDENQHIANDEILLNQIENEILNQERLVKLGYDDLLADVLSRWKGVIQIASINIANMVDGVAYDSVGVFSGKTNSITYTENIDDIFQGKNYRFTIVINDVPVKVEHIPVLTQDISLLLPYIQKAIIEKKLHQAFIKLNHDFVNLIPKLNSLSGVIISYIQKTRTQVLELSQSSGMSDDHAARLRDIETSLLAKVEMFMGMMSANLAEASGYATRVREEITGIVSDNNAQSLPKEMVSIYNFLNEKCSSDQFSDSIETHFEVKSPDMRIMLNRDYFLALLRNIRQNVCRYKKEGQEKGIFHIILSEDQHNQHILFKDFGIGMDAGTIAGYMGKGEFTKPSGHQESQRVGSQDIMDIVRKHGWNIQISSNVATVPADQVNTRILISIPRK